MNYDVSHRTIYSYSQPVSFSHHVLHLTPRACAHQVLHRTALTLEPMPAVCTQSQDYFGNPVAFVALQEQHNELVITARSIVQVSQPALPEPGDTLAWDQVRDALERELTAESLDALQFTFDSPFTVFSENLRDYAGESFRPGRAMLEACLELTQRIYSDFTYDGTATTVSTPVDEVFRIRRGVCQDFAHLQLACLRALGLPARYVSGYLMTHPPEGKEKLVGSDASHAWLSVLCPGIGWIDLDPTNNMIAGSEHITLAWGRDYGDVSPINGMMYGGGRHLISVAVDVSPVAEAGPAERLQ